MTQPGLGPYLEAIRVLAQRARACGRRASFREWRLRLAVAGIIVLLLGAPLRAAETAPGAPSAPAAIPTTEIAARAEQTTVELYRLRAALAEDPGVARIAEGLPALRAALDELASETPLEATSHLSSREVEDLGRGWRRGQAQLGEWDRIVARRTQTVEAGITRVRELDATWRLTAAAAAQEVLPGPVLDEIAAVRRLIDGSGTMLQQARDTVLGVGSEVARLRVQVIENLVRVEVAAERARRQLFMIDAPPLWAVLSEERPPLVWHRPARELAEFARESRERIVFSAVVLLAVSGIGLAARRRVSGWPADVQQSLAVQRLVARPLAAAVLLTTVLGLAIGGNDPVIVTDLAALLLIAPLWRFLRGLHDGPLAAILPALGPVVALSALRQMLPSLSATARLMLLAEDVVLAAGITEAIRPSRVARSAIGAAPRMVGWIGGAALVVLGVALVSNLVGNVSLAALLSRGLLGSILLALGLWAGCMIAEALVDALLYSPAVLHVQAIARRTTQLVRRVPGVLRLVARVAWVAGTLQLFGVFRPTLRVVRDALAARLEVGALSLSAGDLVAFVLTVYVSLVVARTVRALLEDDVLPRLDLPRGVPSAISAGANYLILLIGLLLAASAAGLDIGRVTILAGAFGVGIGFGLQNVVNNFVSGLILLFERPLRIGDVVEVSGVAGSVRRIGIRSSTIATFDGAEVIVPNGTLIAERVTNWTLSDRRRIEIAVGVALGSDPRQVLEVLERVATDHDEVQRTPPPEALLVAFGPGSLDCVLRAWARYDRAPAVRSELIVGLQTALRDAGIAIPVPPRELWTGAPPAGDRPSPAAVPAGAPPRRGPRP